MILKCIIHIIKGPIQNLAKFTRQIYVQQINHSWDRIVASLELLVTRKTRLKNYFFGAVRESKETEKPKLPKGTSGTHTKPTYQISTS